MTYSQIISALPAPFDIVAGTLLPFLVMLGIIVFVHEFGHFFIARLCGVRVETFSLGFGKELFGRTDRHGTRWKVSAIPLGGYVKFEGDLNAASIPDAGKPVTPTSFNGKKIWQKAAVVAAGPAANFILAIALFAGVLMFVGEPQTLAKIDGFAPHRNDGFLPNSPAEEAGLAIGDVIQKVNDTDVYTFQDMQTAVLTQGDKPLHVVVDRSGERLEFFVTPKVRIVSDGFGGTLRQPVLGIVNQLTEDEKIPVKYGLVESLKMGVQKTWSIVTTTLHYVWKMFTGEESTKQLSGPGMMAAVAGTVAQSGLTTFLSFMAFVSVSIGLVNLFPVPILDGGHLVFYALEAIRGKPLGPNATEWAARIGFSFVILLMFVGTFNDIVRWLVLHGFGS